MTITVAVPFYADVDLLGRALRSLIAQDRDAWEAVVVDDAGPAQGARELVEEIGGGRIRYVRNSVNLGLAANWNRCLELATGDWVTIFHADDELRSDYVRLVSEAHRVNPDAVAVYTGASVIGTDGRRMFSFPDEVKRFTRPRVRDGRVEVFGERGLQSLLRGQHIFCPALSFKRERLPVPTFRSRWRQVADLDLLARLLVAGERIVGIPQPAYRYRRHGGNQTALLTASLDRFREEIAVYEEIADMARRQGWTKAARTAERATVIGLHLRYRVALSLVGRDPAQRRACLGLLREWKKRSPTHA